MNIYKYEDYRIFLKDLIYSMPKKGYGQLLKLSKYLGVNSAYLSQVFKETKSLSVEQGLATASFFNLSKKETEYFLLLVQLDRAGTKPLRELLIEKMKVLQEQNLELKNRVNVDKQLEPITQAIFYSDWTYTAIRQTTALQKHSSVESICSFLNLDSKKVLQVLEFLVNAGLCERNDKGYSIGARRTHLEMESPFRKLHHQNWRLKAVEQVFDEWSEKVHYTSPMTISQKDAKLIRETIVEMIERVNSVADHSKSEELVCFNVDWFRVVKK